MISIITQTGKLISILGGIQGPAGPPGPQGPSGGGGGGSSSPVNVAQTTPSSLWTVNHNLGFKPQVQVYSSGGVEVIAQVTHVSDNQYQVSFTSPRIGFSIYQ